MIDSKITSLANQSIKDVVRLRERRGERADAQFVVEGTREISRALAGKYNILEVYACDELMSEDSRDVLRQSITANIFHVSRAVYAKIAMREDRDGLVAVVATRAYGLNQLRALLTESKNLIVALEDVEKPGNLGAVLRSADGAGVGAVVVLDQTIDIYNPNVVRASLGGLFSVPVVKASSAEFFDWCKQHSWTTVAAALSAKSKDLYSIDLRGPTALVLGTEAKGLSEFWLSTADYLAVIPMLGVCDSLNVSVAASVFMYETLRQRTKG